MAWSAIGGQPMVLRLLQRHLAQGRVPSAFLFTGPEGVGKRLTAFEVAKALNCERLAEEACDQCEQCRRIDRRVHPDVHELTPQGALEAIRIDEIRQVMSRIALRPFMARVQVVILDGADRLTEEAANSLLKLLEEPPGHARLFLLASQPTRCLPTIVSRCEMVRFWRLPSALVEAVLQSRTLCDPQAAKSISRLAQGSLAKAIALAAQWDEYRALIEQCGDDEPTRWMEWAAPTDRKALSRWLAGAIGWLHDVTVMASAADQSLLDHPEAAEAISRQARRWDRERCIETALRLIALWDSLEQLVSPRMVGALVREEWLALIDSSKGEVRSSK